MAEIGELVHVWPHPGKQVRQYAELNRYLPPEGMTLPWSQWLEERHGDGSILLTDPAPKKATVAIDADGTVKIGVPPGQSVVINANSEG